MASKKDKSNPVIARIEKLANDPLQLHSSECEESLSSLCSLVKQYECEDPKYLEPVANVLPRLAPYLLDRNSALSGYTISIFRRVDISQKTVQCLLELQYDHANSLLVEALGLICSEDWSDDIENALVTALSNKDTVDAAARALHRHVAAIKHITTLRALAAVITNRECSSSSSSSSRAVSALICLANHKYSNVALQLISDILDSASPVLYAEIIKTLGWATDSGFPLLKRASTHTCPNIKLATIEALDRGYLNKKGAVALLNNLKNDKDIEVKDKAAVVLKSLHKNRKKRR